MLNMANFDSLDARILLALDEHPQASVVALADALGVARNTVHARLRRLEAEGALGAPSVRLDPAALGYPLTAFVTMQISQQASTSAAAKLSQLPEIVEMSAITGDGDLFAKVVARDTADLYRTTNVMLAIPGVERTSTSIVLQQATPYRVAPLLHRIK